VCNEGVDWKQLIQDRMQSLAFFKHGNVALSLSKAGQFFTS
jgi:hypothetical protein